MASLLENPPFEIGIDIFDGSHEESLEKARNRYRIYQQRGDHLSFLAAKSKGRVGKILRRICPLHQRISFCDTLSFIIGQK